MPVLTRATYEHRLGEMQAFMATHEVDALLFLSADFFQWATNFHVDVLPWERPIMVCIPASGPMFAIMNELSTNHMRFSVEKGSVWLEDVSFYAEHPQSTGRQPLISQLPELIAQRLAQAGLSRSRIAVDGASGLLGKAAALLPDIKFLTLTSALRGLRWVKTAEELEIMRAAAGLADWLQDRYRENIRPGRLVQELDYQMATLMVEEGARRFPGENLEVMRCWTLSGPASASPHGDGASCGARIGRGHGLVNIVIPRLNGIVIENERTWFCGKPSADQSKYYEVARAANEAALNAAVTGAPVCAIDAAAQRVVEKADCAHLLRHRTGHGMGIIGHEYPEDMAFNYRPLKANEVYSAEPGIYVYGLGGFRMDDTVVVGSVPVVLTTTPKNLHHATVQ